VDINTRRQKQKALITELLERKIRLHAQQLYDQRGQAEGTALQDWIQAESEVLKKSILAPLYRRTRAESQPSEEFDNSDFAATGASSSEAGAN
jgi:hypothetical protein